MLRATHVAEMDGMQPVISVPRSPRLASSCAFVQVMGPPRLALNSNMKMKMNMQTTYERKKYPHRLQTYSTGTGEKCSNTSVRAHPRRVKQKRTFAERTDTWLAGNDAHHPSTPTTNNIIISPYCMQPRPPTSRATKSAHAPCLCTPSIPISIPIPAPSHPRARARRYLAIPSPNNPATPCLPDLSCALFGQHFPVLKTESSAVGKGRTLCVRCVFDTSIPRRTILLLIALLYLPVCLLPYFPVLFYSIALRGDPYDVYHPSLPPHLSSPLLCPAHLPLPCPSLSLPPLPSFSPSLLSSVFILYPARHAPAAPLQCPSTRSSSSKVRHHRFVYRNATMLIALPSQSHPVRSLRHITPITPSPLTRPHSPALAHSPSLAPALTPANPFANPLALAHPRSPALSLAHSPALAHPQ